MKTFKIVLITGVQIEFKENDLVKIDEVVVPVTELAEKIHTGSKNVVMNVIQHWVNDAYMIYYVPSEKISWMYLQEVQEVIDGQTDDKEQS